MGYQEYVKDAFYDNVVKQYRPKWFVRHLSKLAFRELTDEETRKTFIKWISEVAASIWGEDFEKYIIGNRPCDKYC